MGSTGRRVLAAIHEKGEALTNHLAGAGGAN